MDIRIPKKNYVRIQIPIENFIVIKIPIGNYTEISFKFHGMFLKLS